MKKHRKTLSSLASLAASLALVPLVQAAQFSVHLADQQGPTIDGVVDTTADMFTITSWTDSSLTPLHRVPLVNQFPMVLQAFDATGSLHDIPDAWNGSLGSTAGWAFLLPVGQDLTTVQWQQGQPTSAWQGASFGWGGLRNSLGNVVVRGFGGNTIFAYLPVVGASSVSDIQFEQVTITPIPEPTSLALLILGCIGCAYLLKCRHASLPFAASNLA